MDTCVISEIIRPKPNGNVIDWFQSVDEDMLFLSVVSVGEIQKGVSKLNDTTRKNQIRDWLDSVLSIRFANRILPIDQEIALLWGEITGEATAQGIIIPDLDGLIGATARRHNLTVATRNEKGIQPTGAKVFNPWKAADNE